METTSASEFGWLARQLSVAARAVGLKAPGFRSPPAIRGKTRTVRRYAGGNCLVSIQTKSRPRQAVISDMIEGIIVANQLGGGVAEAARRTLSRALALQETPHAA